MIYEDELIKLIREYLYHNDKIRQITNYLYNHTELFEKRYEEDYNHDLYEFFASKITIATKYENTLLKTMNDKQIEKLNYLKMIER